jgi:hypothetical protein
MKLDLIVPGGQYVCALKVRHILIPGTETTYLERYEELHSLDLDTLPKAAVEEYKRLCKAVGAVHGHPYDSQADLASRINRCEGVISDPRITEPKYHIGTNNHPFIERFATIVTVVAKEPKRVTVEADFVAQTKLGVFEEPCRATFDPTVPELADVDEDASEEEIDEWWETHHNGLRDDGGTLRAVVHSAAIKSIYDDELIDRLNSEYQERLRQDRAWSAERRREIEEKQAGRTVEKMIEETLREANRPPDDSWETLA